MKRYEGLIAAAHTPFDASGDLNLRAVEAQADVLAESRVLAAFVCGSTGESHSLTTDERRAVASRWVQVARGTPIDVIVHVGANCQRDAVALAAHAQEVGAAAVSAMAPCYFRPAGVDELIDFLAPIGSACGALPFYYYDIPSMTGVRLPIDVFLERAGKRIGNLAGVKYTSDDLTTLQACIGRFGERYEMLYGTDEALLAALALGVRGGIGSTYNYAAPLYHRLLEAFRAGDLARAAGLQRQSVEMVRRLIPFGVLRAGKAVMRLLGVDCGPVRSPIRALAPHEEVQLYRAMAALDVFPRPLREPAAA